MSKLGKVVKVASDILEVTGSVSNTIVGYIDGYDNKNPKIINTLGSPEYREAYMNGQRDRTNSR